MSNEAPNMNYSYNAGQSPGASSSLTMATLIARIKSIVTNPKDCWPAFKAEPATVGDIYRNYVVYIAAIPAVAGFIGMSIVGVFGIRIPIVTGIIGALFQYAVALLMVYIGALVAEKLAPTFGGKTDRVSAVKFIAYAFTPTWVCGIFSVLPVLAWVGIIGGLYSIYVYYQGITPMTGVPTERRIGFAAVSVIAMIVLGAIFGIIVGTLVAAPIR